MTIQPLAQVDALREAQAILLKGKYEGVPLIDAKLGRARAYLAKQADEIAASILAEEPDAAEVQNG